MNNKANVLPNKQAKSDNNKIKFNNKNHLNNSINQ